MSFKKILLGLMSGITTGSIFGVGYTSKKGAAMRKKMLADENQYANVLKGKVNRSVGRVTSNLGKFFKKNGIPSLKERTEITKKKQDNKLHSSNL
jgi:hypothetical protein